MNTEPIERPAPGVCWTYHPKDAPATIWSWFETDAKLSPYFNPEWASYWERVWPDTVAEMYVIGTRSGGVLALTAVRRRRFRRDWVFCQPYGTAGVVCSHKWDSQDNQLLRDILLSICGKECVQLTLNGDVEPCNLDGLTLQRHKSVSWLLDNSSAEGPEFPNTFSENHRRNIERGAEAEPEIAMIYGPAEVERMQSAMTASRSGGQRMALDPVRGPLFAEIFAGTRRFRWYTAWHGGRCAATCLWMVSGSQAVYLDGAVDEQSSNSGINHFLFAHALQDMHTNNVRRFDFGSGPRGRSSTGLIRFKEGWGAQAVERFEITYRRPLYSLLRRIV